MSYKVRERVVTRVRDVLSFVALLNTVSVHIFML